MTSTALREPAAGAEGETAPAGPHRITGVKVVLGTFILTQFVVYAFAGSITLQKVAALVGLPLGIALIGHIRTSAAILTLATTLTLALGARPVVDGGIGAFVGVLGVTLPGAIGAFALYTALTAHPEAFRWFAKAWVAAGVVSAAISIPQAVGAVPLVFVGEAALAERETGVAGFVRATGLHFDPNFQALALVLALAFAHVFTTRNRILVQAVLIGGIMATFSRMGMLLAVVILIGEPLVGLFKDRRRRAQSLRRLVAAGGVIGVAVVAFGALAPPSLQEYADQRVQDLVAVASAATGGSQPIQDSQQVNRSSGETRLNLVENASKIIGENPAIGVGAFNVEKYSYRLTGEETALHNTYLELLAVGGLLGLAHMLAYLLLAGRALRAAGARPDEQKAATWIAVVIAVAAVTLTLVYNSVLWLPVVLALAAARTARNQRRPVLAG